MNARTLESYLAEPMGGTTPVLSLPDLGAEMHALCAELFPICRSLTGAGFRESLDRLGRVQPGLQVTDVPSGTAAFDWKVPLEWTIHEAYIVAPDGRRLCDMRANNLHVVGYSVPVDRRMGLDELQQHLHSLPALPDAIPYITSYYTPRWGFCISQRERDALQPGSYRAVIRSTLAPGHLRYGEWRIPGESQQEVLLSTYLCHPSMANNELSGPVVTAFLARHLAQRNHRRLSYRIVVVPETIGAITYLSRHAAEMKQRTVAGFQVTCVGDDRCHSYMPSRRGNTAADRAAQHVLGHLHPGFKRYSFLDRGSDERQYCSPGIDLPVASVMRSMYATYPEYHTSLDDLSLVTPAGLAGGYEALLRCIDCLELDETLACTVPCEPQLGRRGLYPALSTLTTIDTVRDMMNLLAYCDGEHSLLEIADIIGTPLWTLAPLIHRLKAHGLLAPVAR